MSAEWPSSLPQAMVLTHTEAPTRNVAEFQPFVGPPVLYQTGDVQSNRVSGRVRLSDAQRETLLAFYRDTCAMGTRRFEWQSGSFDGERWLCQWDTEAPYTLEGAAAGWWAELSLWLVRRIS